jgi:hypothetical protein
MRNLSDIKHGERVALRTLEDNVVHLRLSAHGVDNEFFGDIAGVVRVIGGETCWVGDFCLHDAHVIATDKHATFALIVKDYNDE